MTGSPPPTVPVRPLGLVVVDPGHFHAALLHQQMPAGVSPTVNVYAPLDDDLIRYLDRVAAFNTRGVAPTSWRLQVHAGTTLTGPAALQEHAGDAMVLSGRNRAKLAHLAVALGAHMHALVDKPWILASRHLPALEDLLGQAERSGRVAYDMMTERFEVTSQLQRELLGDRDVFGRLLPGTPEAPAIRMESVHHLLKRVAGRVLQRPTWFFDVEEQGEGLSDVGTHLVDLVQWIGFPDEAIDHRSDMALLWACHWPTVLSPGQYAQVTRSGAPEGSASEDAADFLYDCNTQVGYRLRGVQVVLNVLWDWESPDGSDSHFASFQGSVSRVDVRQTRADGHLPEVYVVPNDPGAKSSVVNALRARIDALQVGYAGLGFEDLGQELRLTIPACLRTGHEAHFGRVLDDFIRYCRAPATVPKWERPNMLAKYSIATRGVELARASQSRRMPRILPY